MTKYLKPWPVYRGLILRVDQPPPPNLQLLHLLNEQQRRLKEAKSMDWFINRECERLKALDLEKFLDFWDRYHDPMYLNLNGYQKIYKVQ